MADEISNLDKKDIIMFFFVGVWLHLYVFRIL